MSTTRCLVGVTTALLVAGCSPAKDTSAADAGPAATAARATPAEAGVPAISTRRVACIETAEGDPVVLQACDDEAIAAAGRLIPKARNAALNDMLLAMFEPLLFRLAGEDTLSGRVAVSAAYSDLALARARILSGGPSRRPDSLGAPNFSIFDDQADLAKAWGAIRAGDCAAYPVPDCAARLDAALAGMLDGLAQEARAN